MKERFQVEKTPIFNAKKIDRRQVVAGLLTVPVAATMAKVGLEYDGETAEPKFANRVKTHEAYDNKSHSGYFKYDVERFAEEMKTDAQVALDRVAVIDIIQKHFSVRGIDREVVRVDLARLLPALAFTESRLDTHALSEEKAFGALQIMPDTWNDLVEEGESITSLIDQVKVAGRLLEQTYEHLTDNCAEELAMIEREFFNGNTTEFEHYFLTPLLINSYNAGMGTMTQLVKKFGERFKNKESLVEIFEQSEYLTDYDVFIGMAHTADNEAWVKWYKDMATNYTAKVYAGYTVLTEAYEDEVEGKS